MNVFYKVTIFLFPLDDAPPVRGLELFAQVQWLLFGLHIGDEFHIESALPHVGIAGVTLF